VHFDGISPLPPIIHAPSAPLWNRYTVPRISNPNRYTVPRIYTIPKSIFTPLCNLPRLDFQVYSLFFLQVTNDSEQIAGLGIPLRAKHAHEAFA
jgi:hypothetical protein